MVGATFFLLPEYSADNFPWSVTPFEAMTIGGWAIGTGLIALEAGWRWRPQEYPGLLYLWTFSLLQLLVVVVFLGALKTAHWLTWPYLLALGLGTASAVCGLPGLLATRPWAPPGVGSGIPRWVRGFAFFVVIVLAFLGLILVVHEGPIDGKSVFPDALTPFTVRAFAAFFLSLLVGVASLFLTRDPDTWVSLARMGLYLIVPITLAALVNIGLFDFAAHPGGLVYIGLYLVVGVGAAYGLWWRRTSGGGSASSR